MFLNVPRSLCLLLASNALLLCACHPSEEFGELEIQKARVRAPVPGKDIAVGYLVLTNHGDIPLDIVEVSSPGIRAIEIHTTRHIDGQVRMQKVPVLTLTPGESAEFVSGGMHLMLFGAQHLNTAAAPTDLKLRFETASGINTEAKFSVEGW